MHGTVVRYRNLAMESGRRRDQQHVRSQHIDELQGMDRRGPHCLSQSTLRDYGSVVLPLQFGKSELPPTQHTYTVLSVAWHNQANEIPFEEELPSGTLLRTLDFIRSFRVLDKIVSPYF